MDQVFHHTLPQEGRGTFEVPLSRSTWTVANACISTIGTSLENATRCEHADDLRAYVERLGIPARWNSCKQPGVCLYNRKTIREYTRFNTDR